MRFDPQTTAFLFPGQGSQALGMGRDLASKFPVARRTFAEADAILNSPLSKLMWEGLETELNDTINTQPALYVHSIAALRVFQELHPDFLPAVVAGHSLGELTALTAAGALAFEVGLRLVYRRGGLMKRAGELAPGGMAAILGLDISPLEKVCIDASTAHEVVQVANDNCPGQVVISGAKAAVERAMSGAKVAGAKRAVPLAVSIAAHSPLMASIQADWNASVEAAAFSDAKIPVMGNVHATAFTSSTAARDDLMAQMQSRVRWIESIRNLLALGIQNFVEIGSGNVLIGLLKRISSDGNTAGWNLGMPDDFQKII